MTPQEQVDHVVSLERRLLQPGTRSHREALEELLDPEFTEIGASGRLWHRADLVAAMLESPSTSVIADAEMTGRLIVDGVVLLTFVTDADGRTARRTSLWRRHSDGAWRLRHHQGTLLG